MTKNVNSRRGSNGAAAFLTQDDVVRGYADAIVGDVWPDYATQSYEWGRYIGAEVRLLEGANAPRTIPRMQRITKEWKQRLAKCTAYRSLVRQHFTRYSRS